MLQDRLYLCLEQLPWRMAPCGEGSRLSDLILLHSHWIILSLAKRERLNMMQFLQLILGSPFHAAQHSLDPHFGSILFQGIVGSQKPLSLFHHITQCCNPIRASHPVGKRAMQSSLCLLPWGTVNTGLPLARRWLQAFTCTGIFTRAITGLILFCGLKIFFSPSCVISAYLLEMAAFLTAAQ